MTYTNTGMVLKIDTGIKFHYIFWNFGVPLEEFPDHGAILIKIKLIENLVLEASSAQSRYKQ